MLLFTVRNLPSARKSHSRKISHLIPLLCCLFLSSVQFVKYIVRMKYAKCAHQTIIFTAFSRAALLYRPCCEFLPWKLTHRVYIYIELNFTHAAADRIYNKIEYNTFVSQFHPAKIWSLSLNFFYRRLWFSHLFFLFIVVIVCNIKYIHHNFYFSPRPQPFVLHDCLAIYFMFTQFFVNFRNISRLAFSFF